MKISILLLALAASSDALCPYAKRALEDPEFIARNADNEHVKQHLEGRQSGPAGLPFTTFDKNQLIDVTGDHAYAPPGPGDIRGPCPGLNALSNHGYFPRNGVVPLLQAAQATEQVYGLALNFGIPLTIYATLVDGDIVGQAWSIGKAQTQTIDLGLLGKGDGLSGSHNKYESDASVSRGDYYLYNGDVNSVRIDKFTALYNLAKNDPVPNYNLDVLIKHRNYSFQDSVNKNPYFFFEPFAGVAVANAAHTFIPALMSNHSTEYPNGIVSKETLKSFFAITEASDGTLSWQPGHERIPDNWYRRPLGEVNDYSPASFASDFIKMASVVPQAASVGGNTGTTNSFAGVELSDLTGGAYRTSDLLDPKKLVCYFYQIQLAVVPDFLRSRAAGASIAAGLSLLSSKLAPYIDPSCAKIGEWLLNVDGIDQMMLTFCWAGNYNDTFTKQFPGAAVNPN
ncbi:MAG: hypothetical protein M1812_007514 [Candelaria pacifica]|nr:MAG: hypothetical protein M1812_007514 [Candelaria pacifica]